jgi:teichuronic acid biosynthesis glycosyltransferase TuaC
MPFELTVVTSLFPSPPRPREGTFAAQRCAALAARGHRLNILQPVPRAPWGLARGRRADFRQMPAFEQRQGLPIQRPRYWHVPGAGVRNAERFAAAAWHALAAREAWPQALLLDYAWPAAVLTKQARARGVPVLISGRGSDILAVAEDATLAPHLAAALRWADVRLAVSEDLCRSMDRLAGQGQSVLVPNGVDREVFFPGERRAARQRLGLNPAGPLVLVVGHLIPRKDPLRALAVFAAGAPANAELVFLGRGELEGELRGALRAQGLEPRVRLIGEAPAQSLGDWYRAADLLLLTSRREGRPNVVIEALACGCPVLATAVGGTPELLRALPECLGPNGSAADLAPRLQALLAAPPAGDRLLAAVQHLSWERCAALLEELVLCAIARRTNGALP